MNDIEVFLVDFLDEFADVKVTDCSKNANLVELNLLELNGMDEFDYAT